MNSVLLISVRLHEGWYNGSGDTPSPARLFQALVAGAGLSGPLDDDSIGSLSWLERLPPPVIGSPAVTPGQPVVNYVPNNDLDAKQGDHRRVGEIRTKKVSRPLLFDAEIPFLFAWTIDPKDAKHAESVAELASKLYQFGRTVDMAWAWAEVLSTEQLEDRLRGYNGIVREPAHKTGDVDCPTTGSLESLHQRYAAASQRFGRSQDNNGQTFRRRPKPKWRRVSYDNTPLRVLLELRNTETPDFAPWPIENASELVVRLRDNAAERLRKTLDDRIPEIEQVLIGRKANGGDDGPTAARVRIVPLPSIGHPQADMQIRRVLVEVPGECPLRADDIAWAFSGLRVENPNTAEPCDVTQTTDDSMLKHFGIGSRPSRIWRTVTPAALPDATRRRIDPNQRHSEAKSGQERFAEELRAVASVRNALRHARVREQAISVKVQREPFDLRGTRVEEFAEGTRFNKHGLWHVTLEFESPISGPLVIGNGRFLGLGVLAPALPPSSSAIAAEGTEK